jgi:hypothetical protein
MKIVKGKRVIRKKNGTGDYIPWVTLNKNNKIVINAAARDLLRDPDFVTIEISDDGIFTVHPSKDKDDYKVTKQGSTRQISGFGIANFLGLPKGRNYSIRFYVSADGDGGIRSEKIDSKEVVGE